MADVPTFTQQIGGKRIEFECPTPITLKRAKTLFDKEPGTISWIDSFDAQSTFWDIGANIGVYSIYAAVRRDCDVYAFEPGAANYYGLNNNIVRNKLDKRIKALPVALDERSRYSTMSMRNNSIGTALHVFGSEIDYKGDRFTPAWLQGAIGVTMSDLNTVFGVPLPRYVKIDVDGLEVAVVKGGSNVFRNSAVESVLVEVDLKDTKEVSSITDMLGAAGMTVDQSVPGNVSRDMNGAEIFNLIFRRENRKARKPKGPIGRLAVFAQRKMRRRERAA